ncbi:hypothetical protein M2333_002664 [Sphingobium sp. B11D3B]|uniref:FecR domain-containing protein n=1 Tax=Sphingobium sp. B11D3B TaxID=2940575 RepID=UPI0022268919|nr:FecR domain-containing protein [Sphingobium sp. B11D3B]MCW2389618.1 hypothetical protein [Sphingobium sp. B11D3B]
MVIALNRWTHKEALLWAATLSLALSVALSGANASTEPVVRYSVAQGENLYTLALRYFIQPGDYKAVQQLNRIADPRRVPTGMELRIPRRLLKREPIPAVVQSYRGEVRIAARPAAVGMIVREGDLIRTGERSFVTLTLPDDSAVALPSNSAVRVRLLRRTVLGNHLERLFAIEQGRANATVSPMTDSLSDFRFVAPTSTTSVRGTQFRVSYDAAAQRATGEVLEGKVAFLSPGRDEQLVMAGFGMANWLGNPLPLLAPPALLRADQAQSDDDLVFAVTPVTGATRYHVQIGRDADFLEVLDEAFSTTPEARLASLPNGSYFVRLTAIDDNQLEGKPATYAFERRLNRINTSLEQSKVGRYRQYLFRWRAPDVPSAHYRFQLWREDEAVPTVDEIGLTGTSFIVTDLAKGRYRWRVMTSELVEGRQFDKWSADRELTVEYVR